MKKNNVINSLVRIENVMCVYRNRSYFNKRVKCIVKLRVFIETCFMLIIYGNNYIRHYFEASPVQEMQTLDATDVFNCYMFLMVANTLTTILLSFYNSNLFNEFGSNIEAVYELYVNNPKFQDIRRKQYRSCLIDMILFVASYVIIVASFVITSIEIFVDFHVFVNFVMTLNLELRFFYENLVFFELIKVIVAPLNVLNASVRMMVEKMKLKCWVENDDELCVVQGELEKWGVASQHLVTASDRLCGSFGVQMAFSFFSAVIYSIIYLYLGISSVLNWKSSQTLGLAGIAYTVISILTINLLIVSSGQRAMSNGEQLHRNLVVLHNLLLGIPGEEAGACARAAAGLARRLRAAPLRLRLLPTLAVQMALLAEILAAVANYTIVLLQFNHVV